MYTVNNRLMSWKPTELLFNIIYWNFKRICRCILYSQAWNKLCAVC